MVTLPAAAHPAPPDLTVASGGDTAHGRQNVRKNKKNSLKIWLLPINLVILHPRLFYGVMVAQQVLVLFVVVRIRLEQLA